MRRTVLLLASMALAMVLLSGPLTDTETTPDAQTTSARPNFVLILADDMRKDDLGYMPKTRSLLGDQGMSFEDAYVSYALCCPSRATIMRGQYAHNHGVWHNDDQGLDSTDGGWYGYKFNGNEQDNVATRLHDAGYRTGLFGKYFNTYDGSAVPVGWDDWFAMIGQGEYFGYEVNDNGTIAHYGTDDGAYSTDVLGRQARGFIDASVALGKPFFAYVAPKAVHASYTPAPRDKHAFDGERSPRLPSFNEGDVPNKPPWIRSLPKLGDAKKAQINSRHEKRAETLQALDDLVEGVVNELRDSGQLDNTYILFTSDNGWHHGEHRIPIGKWRPYEESIHVPLVVRGPGVAAGSSTAKLALNTDYLPTFTDLAGIQTPGYVDGRSLRPVLEGNATTWRNAILLEGAKNGASPAYSGVLTGGGKKYVEYEGGERELYDLKGDPYELSNEYAGAPPPDLTARLDALKVCSGATCRTAENRP